MAARNTITITTMAGNLHVGDTVTWPSAADHRTWWQRFAPFWLGGKAAPVSFEGLIIGKYGSTLSVERYV